MAGQIKVDSINADSNLALKIANTAVAFIDSSGLRPISGNVNLDATATSKLYLPSANTVAIQTAGVTAVTVDSSQNVGIGTASPSATLHVTNVNLTSPLLVGSQTDSLSWGGFFVNGATSSTAGNGIYGKSGASFYYNVATGLNHIWNTNNTERMRIDSSGNVGIGTASPVSKIHAYGTGQIGTIESSGDYSASGAGFIRYKDSTGNRGYVGFGGTSNLMTISNTLTSGVINFDVNGTERMRIDSGGNLLVGVTSWGSGNGTGTLIQATGEIDIERGTVSAATHIGFYNPNGQVGGITTSASTTSYATSSDYRLKNTIAPMTGALDKVALLKPCTYKWNVDGSDGQGFIAHELDAVVPGCVSGEKDATSEEEYEVSPAVSAVVDAEGVETTPAVEAVKGTRTVPSYQGIDTSFLVATLTAALQEAHGLIKDLTARITALEAK